MLTKGITTPKAAELPLPWIIQISAPSTRRLSTILKRTINNCNFRFRYKRIAPEKKAIDPPNPPKVAALAVASNVISSKEYIGRTNADNALKIAATNK